MAEGRMLSRRITRSDKVANLSSDTVRMIYSWIIPYLDVEGRMEANPRLLKADIAPLLDHITTKAITNALQELNGIGLITLYTVENSQYLQLIQFEKNQKNLRKDKESPSKIPAPPANEEPEPRTDLVRSEGGVSTDLVRSEGGVSTPEVEVEVEVEVEDKKKKTSPPLKIKYLDSVFLTDVEYQKLQEVLGQKILDIGIEKLDYSITVKSGKYKDHYKTLSNWFRRGYLEESIQEKKEMKRGSFTPGQHEAEAILSEANRRFREETEKRSAAGKDRHDA